MREDKPQTLTQALESIIIAEKALKDAKTILVKQKQEAAAKQAKYRKNKQGGEK